MSWYSSVSSTPSAILRSRGLTPKGDEMVAVNVRCLDDLDVAGLAVKPFDGRSL